MKPEQTYPPGTQHRRSKSRRLYYPQARVTLQVVFENFGDPKRPIVIPVAPMSITIYNNSYKEADTFSLEFDAKDLPVSPELIRAGSAEIYLFQGAGIGQLPEVVKAKDDPDTPEIEGLEPTIVGLFDDVALDFNESGRTVTIDGTDYTSLFIAKSWKTYQAKNKSGTGYTTKNRRVKCGKKLDVTLRNLMAEVESSEAMSLKVEPDDLSMPTVGKDDRKGHRKGIPVKDVDNYWDVMYSLAIRHGFILFVRGLDVVLTKPNAYLQSKSLATKVAWGRNLTMLRMNRRIGSEQVPIVEVRSYDESARKVRSARYPKNRRQKPVTGLGTVRDEIKIYTIPGLKSDDRCYGVAETLYELLARAEQNVEIETRDLLDLEGNDLINLRTGDAVTIGLEEQATDLLEGMSYDQRIERLANLGFERTVAAEISSSFEKANQFKKPFRVKEASLDWSAEDGLTIQATLQNFVNITGQEA